MCEICRQVHCPSGCPNAPLWEPPTCDLCDGEARWEYDGVHLCTRCLHESVTEDADFEEMATFVSESHDQWHNFFEYLLGFGILCKEALKNKRFNLQQAASMYCDGNEDFFEFLDEKNELGYRPLE